MRMVERAQVDEALSGGEVTRFVVTDGSALVDLMAWAEADFYQNRFDENEVNHLMQYLAGQKNIRVASWWKFIRKAPEIWLINVFAAALSFARSPGAISSPPPAATKPLSAVANFAGSFGTSARMTTA